MRRRMRELGIYSLLGYRKSAMLGLLTFENIFICFGGMVLGILAGSVLHKGVIAGIVALLGITIDQAAIPLIYPAAVKSILSFVVVVLITLTLSNARLLQKSTLLDLVRLEKKTEKPIRVHFITAFIGLSCLLCGYGLALDMMRGREICLVHHRIFPYCVADNASGGCRNYILYLLFFAIRLPENPAEEKFSVSGKYHYRGS